MPVSNLKSLAFTSLVLPLALFVLGGCGDSPTTMLDAGRADARADTGPQDGGANDDAEPDATQPAPDAEPDAGQVAPDAESDAGQPDAEESDSGEADAGEDDAGEDDAGETDAGGAACGDGVLDSTEACDDANTNSGDGCSDVCAVEPGWSCAGEPSACTAICGDGLLAGAEVCDDGNLMAGDGCDAACANEVGWSCPVPGTSCLAICGDALLVGVEPCDDGGTAPADGCSATCEVELGYLCTGSPSLCAPVCGDALVIVPEACDDGNLTDGDGCAGACTVEVGYSCTGSPSACVAICGDGLVAGIEGCDDANVLNGDGCSLACAVEHGYQCFGQPSVCGTVCGDGQIGGLEQCDDANTNAGDGCGGACTLDAGYECLGEPSVCGPDCGDGTIIAPESCDDGNQNAGDGCSSACLVESGFLCSGAPSVCVATGQAVQVSLGGITDDGHGCLLTNTGLVFCFGTSTNGELGIGAIGTTELSRTPVQVSSLSGIAEVASGDQFSCARRTTGGTVACWGDSDNRQLGQAATTDVPTPIDVAGISGATQIGTGSDFACAIVGGSVACWGDNDNRQLGRGGTGTTDSEVPSPVIGITNATQIALGGDHACAVITGGGVLCWGDNDNGQIGIGGTSTTDISVATAPIGLPPVVHVVAGVNHTCALTSTSSGDVWCWGDNANGQIGNNSTTDARQPVQVPGLTGITQLSGGNFFNCAINAQGAVWCWGENHRGQIGDGTAGGPTGLVNNRLVPTPITGLTGALQIDAGEAQTCTLQRDGTRRCWGYDEDGQLGLGTPRNLVTPTAITGLPAVLKVAASEAEFRGGHACARVTGNDLYCWGENFDGQLGDGTQLTHASPAIVPSLAGVVADVAAGDGSTCAVLTNGTVSCWGDNSQGQLGNNSTVDNPTPATIASLTGAVGIWGNSDFFCSTHLDGLVRCWGDNDNRQIAPGTTTDQLVPVEIAGVTAPLDLAVGGDHACARMANQTVMCWGDNDNGQLGDGTNTDRPAPFSVPTLIDVVELGAGQNQTCARLVNGTVQCSGDNAYGQEANASLGTDVLVPTTIPNVNNVVQLSVANNYVCAVVSGGTVTCWGYGLEGNLGTGVGVEDNPTPVVMGGVNNAVHVEAVNSWTFVIDGAGAMRAVGFVGFGHVGTGHDLRPTRPSATAF